MKFLTYIAVSPERDIISRLECLDFGCDDILMDGLDLPPHEVRCDIVEFVGLQRVSFLYFFVNIKENSAIHLDITQSVVAECRRIQILLDVATHL